MGTKKTTKAALEAEERVDYYEALQQYRDVSAWGSKCRWRSKCKVHNYGNSMQALKCEVWSDGQPTQVEEDLWEDSLLSVSNICTRFPLNRSYSLP